MMLKRDIGNLGEDLAVKYLKKQGYKILERNFSVHSMGEIDIIAKDKEEYVFIEVKTRTNENYGKPKDAVNQVKKKHIYKSTECYTYIHNIENEPIRIDVIEIYKKKENRILWKK
mgnify:CR=1 FL=1